MYLLMMVIFLVTHTVCGIVGYMFGQMILNERKVLFMDRDFTFSDEPMEAIVRFNSSAVLQMIFDPDTETLEVKLVDEINETEKTGSVTFE